MTHSLHRRGTKDSISRDFVVLSCSAKGFNERFYGEWVKEFFRIGLKHKPVNFGDMKQGNFLYLDAQEIIDNVSNNTIVQMTFDDKDKVIDLIKELKEADTGVSVNISGDSEVVDEIARETGIGQVHTREYSLGVHGKTGLLPEYEITEFQTMCGHAMISADLVKKLLFDIKKGRRTPLEASLIMGKGCSCGNFNISRSLELIEKNEALWTIAEH